MALHPDIEAHYAQGVEHGRLTEWARLEAIRTRELLARHLPAPPAVVLDVGGAEGAYALPLAAAGYTVHLVDPVARHVTAARELSARQVGATLASVVLGDARALAFPDAAVDAVLLLGPLYHLPEAADRRTALREAHRVLRPGGVLLAAGISRFASALDGLRRGYLHDPAFERIVEAALRDGVHRNPDVAGRPEWFTLAYFHTPDGLRDELRDSGFADVEVLAVEGIGAAADLDAALDDPTQRATVLRVIERLEREPSLLGASPHLMAVGRRTATAAVG